MDRQLFTDTLRRFRWQKPFVPFVVEKEDGESLTISQPTIAFSDGSAILVDEMGDMHFIDAADIRSMRPAAQEVLPRSGFEFGRSLCCLRWPGVVR